MRTARSILARLGAALLLAVVAACATPAAQTPPAPQPLSPVVRLPDYLVWPHDLSDLKPDPDVRYGVLANGMRYAILRNTQPAGVVALRLRIASGALQETDEQRGLAHFLEHMAFNGSKNVPEGEMIKILERKGLAFGPDTNAYTSFGETVYMLDLPKNDVATFETGLMLMRETADRLTISEEAVQREKGVILSDERARDTPEFRATKARFAFWLKGQRVPERFPIGTIDSIKAATSAKITDYYRKHYRPERAMFVVSGDVDVADVEAKIKAQFADWSQPGPAGTDPALGDVAPRTREAAVHVEPSGPTSVTLSYVSAPDAAADTRAKRIRDTRRGLAFDIVNRRLQRLARGADAPFVAASIYRAEVEKSVTLAGLSVSTQPGAWEKGLAAAEQAVRQALQYGVQQAELDREIRETEAGLAAAVTGADTRDTRSLASGLAQAFDDRYVFTHPKDDLAIFAEAVKGFDAASASALLKEGFAGQGPLLFLSTPQPVDPAALAAAYDRSAATPVAAPAAAVAAAWPYANFGAPGAVVSRTRDAALDTDFLTFANGVRLTVKRLTFEKGSVGVTVRFAGGLLALPQAPKGLAWAAPFAVPEGGLGKLDREGLDLATVGKIVGAGFGFDENAIELSGETRPEDLALQMQLLAAYATDPGWRGEGLARLQAAAESQFASIEANPGRVLGRDAGAILRSGDGRFTFPTLAEARALKMDDIRAVVAPLLASAPIEITIVGDIDPKAAEAAVAATFGALPPRAKSWTAPKGADVVRFPGTRPDPIRLTHRGRADQAVGYVAYKGFDARDIRKVRALRLVRQLMRLRLTEEVRERLGASYSPSAGDFSSDAFPGYGFFSATAETPPAQVPEFFRIVDEIAAELRAGKFDDDLIARAREPLVDQAQTSERTAPYWLSALSDAQSNPRTLPAIKSRISDLQTISKAEIVTVANEVLQPARLVRIQVTPATP
ncbi:MAG: insulinase family protein [Alphaproteobacteria bacterium]|nr:insulinase family protein [Alphaproteobacteria bacterium]